MSLVPTVFVVDDEETVRHSMEVLLRVLGFPVRTFPSAELFLESYQESWTGCLFVDLQMPGMGGRELLAELDRRQQLLPAILMTGHADEESLQWAAHLSSIIVLEKPFSVEQMKEVVHRQFAR